MVGPDAARIRLLIVDDHEVVRLGLRTLLSRIPGMQVVGEAGTAAAAIVEAARLDPDVVLLDVRLPDSSGVKVCRTIRMTSPRTRVIFLTSFADEDAVLATILAGGDGYLLKEISGEMLVRAIERVASGQSILDPAVTGRVLARVRSRATAASDNGAGEVLSPQEDRVLALVAEGRTNKEIGTALKLSEKTVRNYLSNIFQKLQVTRRAQAASVFVRRSTSAGPLGTYGPDLPGVEKRPALGSTDTSRRQESGLTLARSRTLP
jgi:two-component system response regulator DevR